MGAAVPRTAKTGSKSERDALRHEMLAAGCTPEMVAGEMERRWGFRPREAHRHAHGWSQDEVAVRFTEIAERLGGDKSADRAPGLYRALDRLDRPLDRTFDRGTAERTGMSAVDGGRPGSPPAPMIGTRIGEYERWPAGGRRPSPYVLTLLAVVFGTTVDRLLDYDDYRNLPDQERTVLGALLVGGNPSAAPPATALATFRAPGLVQLPPQKNAAP
jgi:transcriptional regulator with XRE-family HTH domain